MPDKQLQESLPGSLIMVVDDTPANLQVVGTVLREAGFRISLQSSGHQAIDIAGAVQPDLILLDISMPDINGLDVCRRLKKQPETEHIPVIFLTVHADKNYILEGFQAGAVDFVPKPFDSAELLARVHTHLLLTKARALLVRQNEELQRLNQEKDEFLSITSHDLKNPLSGILSLAEILEQSEQMSDDERRELGAVIGQSSREMMHLIVNFLDVHRIETLGLQPTLSQCTAHECLLEVVQMYRDKITAKKQRVEIVHNEEPITLVTDSLLLRQALDNVFSNAVKYSPTGSCVRCSCIRTNNPHTGAEECLFSICDEGPGLSIEDQAKLFKKFSRLSPRPTGNEHSTGLGLFIARRLVEVLGGSILCQSSSGAGSTFTIMIPLRYPSAS